jgi:hypothetical protein
VVTVAIQLSRFTGLEVGVDPLALATVVRAVVRSVVPTQTGHRAKVLAMLLMVRQVMVVVVVVEVLLFLVEVSVLFGVVPVVALVGLRAALKTLAIAVVGVPQRVAMVAHFKVAVVGLVAVTAVTPPETGVAQDKPDGEAESAVRI